MRFSSGVSSCEPRAILFPGGTFLITILKTSNLPLLVGGQNDTMLTSPGCCEHFSVFKLLTYYLDRGVFVVFFTGAQLMIASHPPGVQKACIEGREVMPHEKSCFVNCFTVVTFWVDLANWHCTGAWSAYNERPSGKLNLFMSVCVGMRMGPCGIQNTMEQWTPQGNSLFNLDPTGEIFRKGNNRTTIAGPHKPPSKAV